MARPQQYFDWDSLSEPDSAEEVVDTRRRLRWILGLFAVSLAIVFGRAVQLELSHGADFRRIAAQPLERTIVVPAPRGRILARDGTPLATNGRAKALAIHYRYLESPPDAGWLRRTARLRLARRDRRDAAKLAAMEQTVRDELARLHARLAELCNFTPRQWQARTARIQRRVAAQAAHVNQRRLERFYESRDDEDAVEQLTLSGVVTGLFAPPELLPPAPLVLAEQVGYHRVVNDVPPEVIATIEHDPKAFAGVKIVDHSRREYPLASAAANLLGHLSSPGGADFLVRSEQSPPTDVPVGMMGLEQQFEEQLRATSGEETQLTDHRGVYLSTARRRAGVPGRDVITTLDAELQTSVEALLDRSLRRLDRHGLEADGRPHGGAIVVLDVQSGEILTAASGPRFDPNWFAAGDPRVDAVLADPAQPMFDRVSKMAIAPGSVFKSLTAIALLEQGVTSAEATFECQGYLTDPERMRCQIFRHQGIGHGSITLTDALAQSCNVYFFNHSEQLGAVRLLEWAHRCGFGQATGIELAGEARGQLPQSDQLREARQRQSFAVGQGAFTATPLQVARFYAAIANGGTLVVPRIMRADIETSRDRTTSAHSSETASGPRLRVRTQSLEAVREGLRAVVDDPLGTGYEAVRLPTLAIAGKSGTAETGGGQSDHAWFAGYAPADKPRIAFVVVLEHAGSGATAAGSVAKSLLQRMQQLGYFPTPPLAEKPLPPGKG